MQTAIAFSWVVLGFLLLFVLFKFLARRRQGLVDDLRRDLRRSREMVLVQPERAHFNGADSVYGRVRCSGLIAATEGHIYFRPLVGKALTLAMDDIDHAGLAKSFHTYSQLKLMHLIITLRDGNRVAFHVRDWEHWIDLVNARRPVPLPGS